MALRTKLNGQEIELEESIYNFVPRIYFRERTGSNVELERGGKVEPDKVKFDEARLKIG